MRYLTRRGFIGLAASAAATALVGCSSGASSAPSSTAASSRTHISSSGSASAPTSELRFATGGQSGTYYEFGQMLAQHASDKAGVNVTALVSNGSKANVEAIRDGMAEFAFCQSDVMVYAYCGENSFEGAPIEGFSVVAALYDEQVQIVACDSGIATVSDLAGKRVSLGAPDSGTYFNALDVLSSYGIGEQGITPTYQPFGDSISSLENGRIDAAFIVAGAPIGTVSKLFEAGKAHLVALDTKHIAELAQAHPCYAECLIAPNTYPGQAKGVATVTVNAVILAADTVTDDEAYAFAKDIFDSAVDPATASAHPKYDELSVEKGASVMNVPYHPGAARFFEEEGYSVMAK